MIGGSAPPRWAQCFTVRLEDGLHEISIGISEPFPDPGSATAWRCEVIVQTPSRKVRVPAIGVTAIQALELAIEHLRLEEWWVVQKYGLALLSPGSLEPEFDPAELKIYLANPPRLAAAGSPGRLKPEGGRNDR